MTFLELTLQNFFSFEHAKVPLHSQSLVTIVGRNLDSSVCGSNGSGKTLIENERIQLISGRQIPIKDVKVGDVVASVNVETHEVRPNKVLDVIGPYKKPLLKLKTITGREVTCGYDHRLFTQRGYIKAERLGLGDFLYVLRKIPVKGVSLDSNLCKVLGYYVAEGSMNDISQLEGEIADDIIFCAKSAGFNIRENYENGKITLVKSDSILNVAAWRRKYQVFKVNSYTKRIPEQIFVATEENKIQFFSTYFNGDGWFEKSGLYSCTASKGLAYDLQTLLQHLGISSRIKPFPAKYNGKHFESWCISIRGNAAVELAELMQPHMRGRRVDQISSFLEDAAQRGDVNENWDVVPKEWQEIVQQTGISLYSSNCGIRLGKTKHGSNRRIVERAIFQLSSRGFVDEANSCDWLASEAVVWDRIVSIEQINNYKLPHCYDLTIERDENFIVNGILSHNSSLIVDAWCWTLYGRTPRGQSGKSVIRREATSCSVSLSFHDGIQHWHVIRYQNDPVNKNNIILFRNGDEGWIDETLHDKRDTQKKLDSIIKIPMDVALSSIILGQNSVAFATMSDGDKKGVLETVLQFDTLNKASMKAKARCGKLRTELNVVVGKHNALFEQRESSQVKKFDMEKQQHSWKVKLEEKKIYAQEQLDGLDQKLLSLRVECFKLKHSLEKTLNLEKTLKQDYDLAVEAHGRARVEVVDLEATFRTLSNQFIAPPSDVDVGAKKDEIRRQHYLRRDQLQDFVSKYEEEIERYQKGIEESICYTCNQPVPKGSPTILHLESVLNQSMEKLASTQESLGEVGISMQQELDKFDEAAANEKCEAEARLEVHNLKIQQVSEQLERARAVAAERLEILAPLQTQMQTIKTDQDNIQKDLEGYNRQISAAEGSQRDLQTLLDSEPEDPFQRSIDLLFAETKDLTTKLEDLTLQREKLSYQLELHDFWVSGFGKKGIQSYMLDSVVPFLNERVAEYSKIMWEGETHIEFATQKLASDGKTLREDFHVIIDNSSGANEYLGNSAGERERIDLVIALAVQDLVISRQGANFNLCVFDEACRFLDAEGAEGYFKILQSLSQRRESIFVISHSPELQSLFGKSWCVVKENKISRLEIAP